MRSKWASGITPRGFTWVFRDRLAVSERPGGSTAQHRKVRRDEELLWLKSQGFNRIISILPPFGNLDVSRELGLTTVHYPLRGEPQRPTLVACYEDLDLSAHSGLVTLLHGDEVSDRLLGVVAGYLVWGERADAPRAIAMVERLARRSLGPHAREVVSIVTEGP